MHPFDYCLNLGRDLRAQCRIAGALHNAMPAPMADAVYSSCVDRYGVSFGMLLDLIEGRVHPLSDARDLLVLHAPDPPTRMPAPTIPQVINRDAWAEMLTQSVAGTPLGLWAVTGAPFLSVW